MRWINRSPSRPWSVLLAALPFLALIILYMVASEIRLAENPADKLLPAPSKIIATADRLLTEPDRRSGRILFWHDTWISLQRLLLGIGISALLALSFGLLIGLLPAARAAFAAFVAALSMVPPLAILPILFLMVGLGEDSKVLLIVIGVAPFLIRDVSQRVLEIPHEQIVKAQTLGATSGVIALRVALPQIMPRLLQAIRLSLGPAWLFLIAAEAIASDLGLGYRIFLVRRFLAMDVILVYVLWITLLAFVMDWMLKTVSRKAFPWTGAEL